MTLSMIDFQNFFPKELEVISMDDNEKSIDIRLKSKSKHYICYKCKKLLSKHHATYNRKVQDLPIFGKSVQLYINAYEYYCETCQCSISENFDGFLKDRSRLTERCENFIVQLALETSCEGASRTLRQLGIVYSGDSIIRLLLKRLKGKPITKANFIIGVDDFAYKKRNYYGTIIVDGITHKPIALLDGRDGKALKEWLRLNQHIKVVTRDRAKEYAKVIQEELPEAVQITDRFHLYENFLQAIKGVLNTRVASAVPVEEEQLNQQDVTPDKSATFSQKLSKIESNKLEKILFIRSYVEKGNSIRKTARDLKVGRDTIAKYLKGNPEELCIQHSNCNRKCEYGIEKFLDFIREYINDGYTASEIYQELKCRFNYKGTFHAFYNHLKRNAKQYKWVIKSKNNSHHNTGKHPKMLPRLTLFNYLWKCEEIPAEWKTYVFDCNPILYTLERCIREFRNIFLHKSIHQLYCFIEHYSKCGISSLETFAKGLLTDQSAVEHAVSSDWSNGFVEGMNNKLKTIKRTMYGRCRHKLLEAKMLL